MSDKIIRQVYFILYFWYKYSACKGFAVFFSEGFLPSDYLWVDRWNDRTEYFRRLSKGEKVTFYQIKAESGARYWKRCDEAYKQLLKDRENEQNKRIEPETD